MTHAKDYSTLASALTRSERLNSWSTAWRHFPTLFNKTLLTLGLAEVLNLQYVVPLRGLLARSHKDKCRQSVFVFGSRR